MQSIFVPKPLTGHFITTYPSSSREGKVEVTPVTEDHTNHEWTKLYFLHEQRSYEHRTW